MTRSKLLVATAIIASVVITACSDMTAPKKAVAPSLSKSPQLAAERDGARREERPSRILHVTKECSQFAGPPGSFCTITSSNVKAIKVGWRVVYASGADATGAINSDVVLGPPGGGPNAAFGHCDVSNAPNGTNLGLCTFSGGTGQFTHFRGRFVVSGNDPLGIVYHWDGPYSFGRRDPD
jgi:hypothetical protein